MDYMTILSYLWKLVVVAPSLGVGIVIGVVGYRFLLKRNPTMLNKLVALAEAELQKLAEKATAKVATVPVPNPAVDDPITNHVVDTTKKVL